MFRRLPARLATLVCAAALALPTVLHAQKALVYCPVGIDAAGCNVIVAALAADAARFPGGADAAFDGTQGTVDLAGGDLGGYAVFVIPSLADGPDVQPYALLRNATIAGRIGAAFMGRTAVWSGTPDVGSTNRAAKDQLIRNLAAWGLADAAGTHGPGVVALQDNSDAGSRFDWLSAISALSVSADTTFDVYSNVQTLTATGATILTSTSGVQIGYTNMASLGLVRGSGGADDATGARTTRVVLVTAAGDPSDPNIATVTTDKDDYVPGDTVTVTGAGWTPAETVRLLIHEDSTGHPDRTLSAVADDAGHILNHEFAIDSSHIGVRFWLTATGLTSGKTAQTTFTDAPRIGAVTVGVQTGTVTYGTAGSATFAASVVRTQNGTVNGTYSVLGLPTGVTGSFTVTTFNANGGTAFPNSTLTLSVAATVVPGSYPFTVRVADGGDVSTGGAGTLVVSPKTITGSITAANKAYDATTAATILTRTLTGVVGADVVTLTGGTATFANKNVGTGKTVTATGLSLTGAQSGRYVLASTSATTTANITAATITATFTAASKVYDGTTTATILSRTPIGVLAGDVVTLGGGTASFASKTVGTAKTVTATGFTLGGTDAGNYLLGTIAPTTADITGQPLTVSFTAADKVYDGTTAATIVTRSIASGLQSGDVVTVNGGTATFANKTVGAGKSVTATGFTLAGVDAPNYTIGTVNAATASITVASVTPSVTIQNRAYDGTTAATIATRTVTGAIAGDDVTLAGGTAVFADRNAGAGKGVSVTSLSLTGADAVNYQLTSTSATATADITALAITVTAASDTKGYDGTNSSAGTPTVTVGALAAGDVGVFTQTFDTRNAGTAKTLTAAGTVTDGNGGNNYAITFAPNATGVITVKPLTPAIVANDKVYDGTATATLSSQTLTGVIAPDVVTLVAGAAAFADKNVGAGKTVTASGLTLSGADGANYALSTTSATGQADITARPLTVTATGVDKGYDATTAATVTLADARVAGDVFTATYASAAFADKHVGAAKPISVTGISISGTDAGNYGLTSTSATATAGITPATVTGSVAASDKVYDGTTAATVTTRSLTGVLGTDDVTLSGGTAVFADKNVGSGKTVTVTGLTLAGGDAGNYVLSSTSATTTASISTASVTPHVTADNKVYDGATTATVATATLTGAVTGDDLSLTVANATFDTRNVGSGKTVTATGLALAGTDAGNYQLSATSATTTADITALALVGSITAADKVYDGTNVAAILTRALAGVIAPDAVSYVGGTATFDDKNAGTGKSVTATGLSLSGADAGNYTVNATATTTAGITPRALVVSASGQTKVYDGTAAATVTLSDDRVAGDVLTLSYASASFTGKQVGTGKPVSVSGIDVTGGDAGNYTWNTSATTTADITARTLTVTATGQSRIYDATTAATVTLADDRVAGDMLTLAHASAVFTDKHAGTAKPISVSGISVTGADAGNYTWNTTATAAADVTPRALVVTATGQSRIYDGTTAATVTLADDRISGDVFTAGYSSATFADKHVGTAKPVSVTGINLSGPDAGDYTPDTTASTMADITPRALLVTATGQNKLYDATTSAAVTLSDDRVAGDLLTLAYASAAFADKHAGTAKPVSVSGISVTGTDAGNYSWNTTATATADIGPRGLVVTATGVDKLYDGTAVATVTLGDDRIAGDVFTAGYASAAFANKSVGTAKPVSVSGISLSGADAGDYTPNTSASTTADITARPLAVTATGIDKAYDAGTAATVTLADDRVAGDILTTGYTAASFADKNVGTGKTISVSGINVTGADAGNYTWNTTTSATAAITARALAISATGVHKVYDGTTAATVTLADDRVAGDVFTASYASAAFGNKNVGTGKPVSVTGIAISGVDAGNYAANTSAGATADIAQASMAVTATGVNKAYDGGTAATVNLVFTPLLTDVVTAGYASAAFTDKNVATGKPVTVTGIALAGADAPNYVANGATTTTADITPLALTGAITASTKVYDATVTATIATRTLTGVIAPDVVSYSGGAATFANRNVGTAKAVSATGLGLTGADAGNYTVNASAGAAADITPLGITGSITVANKVYDAATTATIATRSLTGVLGTDVVSYVGGTAAFADKNVGNAKPVAATGLSLSGADQANYTVNTAASATANITAASSTTVVTSSPVSLPYSDAGQMLPLAATVTSPTVPGVSEGSVVFTIKNSSNVTVGSTAPVNAVGGAVTASYSMPGMTDVGTYTIQAAFTGANFAPGSSGTGTLTLQPASFETTTATTDADFKNADDLDVLFKNDGKLSTLKLQNTNPGTVHYQLQYRNVTGVDINASNGATLKTIIEIPPMTSCGAVTCPTSSIDKTVAAWSLKGARAVHVAPDDRTDDMAVQFSYKASGSCADETTGYVSSLAGIAANAPKCIRVTGFAIPKKHRARIDLHLEFRWKDSGGWAPTPDPKLYFYSGFAFKSTSTANFPNVVPSVRTSYESAGLVAAGQKVTAAGGFVFDAASNPVGNYHVRLFNTASDAAAPTACAAGNAAMVAEAETMLDGFWFVWKKGSNQANLSAPELPSKVQYAMVVCSNAPTPAAVASRTMSSKMPDKEFDQEDFRLTTMVASGP